MEAIHIRQLKNINFPNYTYLYDRLKEIIINDAQLHYTVRENQQIFGNKNNLELVSYKDVTMCLKEDLLPFFESIFSYNLFDIYINSNNTNSYDICDILREKYIKFIFGEANVLAKNLIDFKKGDSDFYPLFSTLEKDLIRNILRYVFKSSQFIGKETYYLLHGDSNKFIKEYLTAVLIQIRENPKAVSSRLLQLEINRVQTLILKNANFNFLNWYLNELKSTLKDLKFIYEKQPNYGLNCSEIVLRELYRELKRWDFIEIGHTSETNFVEVFLKDWYSHKSICALKMDNLQTKYFLDQFKVHIDSAIKVSDIEKVKNIVNKNGFISSASLSASFSRSKEIGPKREDDLVAVFRKN